MPAWFRPSDKVPKPSKWFPAETFWVQEGGDSKSEADGTLVVCKDDDVLEGESLPVLSSIDTLHGWVGKQGFQSPHKFTALHRIENSDDGETRMVYLARSFRGTRLTWLVCRSNGLLEIERTLDLTADSETRVYSLRTLSMGGTEPYYQGRLLAVGPCGFFAEREGCLYYDDCVDPDPGFASRDSKWLLIYLQAWLPFWSTELVVLLIRYLCPLRWQTWGPRGISLGP
jgi:hypothetical protein